MILNNAPTNEAIMKNVSSVGEFHIRNSAKAFNILSSGLYANKIRAIIRELSCNAVDSHTAAGKDNVAFEVHLPNILEPWFSVKDYGVGLSHDQVINMYTTYFESTKTNSNSFIGALGLGSKSPFSYTDNFTVNAIKDGTLNIYSAIINAEGVPSIVLMQSSPTKEINGVEIRFSVNERADFSKFIAEAQEVFLYFKNKPKIFGCASWVFKEVQYKDKDIVPGVHVKSYHHYTGNGSVAVMGNIAYPINVPNREKNLGDLGYLLDNNLEMHFGIGELDFQASREGLSYIPSTIESIKNKLEELNKTFVVYLKKEADLINNTWERSDFLHEKGKTNIWRKAVQEYYKLYNHPLYVNNSILVKDEDIKSKFNIEVIYYSQWRGKFTKSDSRGTYKGTDPNTGVSIYLKEFVFGPSYSQQNFVNNDVNVGVIQRCTYNASVFKGGIYVLSAFDKKKSADFKGFYDYIHNPPEHFIIKASDLPKKPKEVKVKGAPKSISILKLQKNHNNDYVFKHAGKSNEYDEDCTHYYLPIVGFNVSEECITKDMKTLAYDIENCGIPQLTSLTLYGVRKADIEEVKTLSNWVNVEDYIKEVLSTVPKTVVSSFALNIVDHSVALRKNKDITKKLKNATYVDLSKKFCYNKPLYFSKRSLNNLVSLYSKGNYLEQSIEKKVKSFQLAQDQIKDKYPLLERLVDNKGEYFNLDHVAHYINAVDSYLIQNKE